MYGRDRCYAISVVAKLLEVHPQTLRQYERLGLVIPKRTAGNIRRYTDSDIEKLMFIQRMVGDLGVNLAGVEIILNMREKMLQLRLELEELRKKLNTYGFETEQE